MRVWGMGLLTALCLVFSGCGESRTEHTSAAGHFKPTLDVGLTISGNTANMKITTDLKISAEHRGQERVNGEGHIHIYLDNGEKMVVDKTEQTFKDLSAGKHTLKISLHNNDHTPYDVTDTKEFEIK